MKDDYDFSPEPLVAREICIENKAGIAPAVGNACTFLEPRVYVGQELCNDLSSCYSQGRYVRVTVNSDFLFGPPRSVVVQVGSEDRLKYTLDGLLYSWGINYQTTEKI